MRDPDQDYLNEEKEAADRHRYADYEQTSTSSLNFSDLTLKEEVGEALAFHEDIDASQIEIDARGGVITLFGEVDSEREKLAAADCASEVDGVLTVLNQIRVHPL